MKDERTAQWDGSYSPISGLELAYNSTTVLRVKAGTATVNGTNVAFSQTDYTSASTMKSVANATVTLAADSAYWVFLSSGGVIGIELNDGTGDGATPVFDTALDYWKAASTGAAWRRLGSFWTDASALIIRFYVASLGRTRRFYTAGTDIALVNGVANASYTAITLTPYYTADMVEILVLATAVNAGSNTVSAQVLLSVDGGGSTNSINYVLFNSASGNSVQTPYLREQLPYTGTLHYATNGSTSNNTLASIYAIGFSQFV